MKKFFAGTLIVLMSVLCITGCGKKANTTNSDNLDVQWFKSFDDTEVIVQVINNNNYDIGIVNITYTYKDANDKVLNEDTDVIYDFKSKAKYVASYDSVEKDDGSFYIPDKVEIKAEIDQDYQKDMGEIVSYTNQISSDYKRVDDEIEVTLTNNSNKTFTSVDAVVIYKKAGKYLTTRRFSTGTLNSTVTDTVPIPIDFNASETEDIPLDFDDVEIIVTDASVLIEDDSDTE